MWSRQVRHAAFDTQQGADILAAGYYHLGLVPAQTYNHPSAPAKGKQGYLMCALPPCHPAALWACWPPCWPAAPALLLMLIAHVGRFDEYECQRQAATRTKKRKRDVAKVVKIEEEKSVSTELTAMLGNM